jgi:hypothetical protein
MKTTPLFLAAFLAVLGLSAGIVLLAQDGQNAGGTGEPPPPPPPADTNCIVATISTNCVEGSVALTNVVLSRVPAGSDCVGSSVSGWLAAPSYVLLAGTNVTLTTYKNSAGAVSSNCPPTATTNIVVPNPDDSDKTWQYTGVQVPAVQALSGYGSVAGIITPICPGTGVLTFQVRWKNLCDDGYSTNALSTNFTVRCPTMTAAPVAAYCSTKTGATFRYCYDCVQPGTRFQEFVETLEQGCPSGGMIANLPAAPLVNGCWNDDILASRSTSPDFVLDTCQCNVCTNQSRQIIALFPPGATAACCFYTNIQTTIIIRTSTNPSHGYVISDSWGTNTLCSW